MTNKTNKFDAEQLAEFLLKSFGEEEILKEVGKVDWTKYQWKPELFLKEQLDMYITDDMKKLMDSVVKYKITVAISANAVGKSLPIKTKVMTPSGYKEIGSLQINDFVVGRNGKKIKVVGVYPQGLQPTYKISFNDQTSILCSEDHLWNARSSSQQGRNRPFQTYTTKELSKVLHRSMNIPMCDPVEFKEKEFIIDPYVMGILLGDGSLTTAVRLTSADQEIIDEVSDRIEGFSKVIKYHNKYAYGITTERGKENLILNEFRRYGLIGSKSDKKFIPKDYLLGSIKQRKELLAGLLDADGYISKGSVIQISTASSVMASQIRELVWSLGGTARQSVKNTFYRKNGKKIKCLDANILTIKLTFNPFKLTRKTERWIDPKTKGIRCMPCRKITNIEYIGEVDSVCIRVDAKDSLFVADKCIVTHNSHLAGALSLWWYKAFPGSQVLTFASPPERQLREGLWGKIRGFCRQNPALVEDDKVNTLKITPNNSDYSEEDKHLESMILGITIPSAGDAEMQATRVSGFHSPYQLAIGDEADGVPDGIFKGLEGVLSGDNSRLLLLFNPKVKSGFVFRLIKDGLANVVYLSAMDHPNVISGEDLIPGAVSRAKTIQRINDMTRSLRKGEQPDPSTCFEVPEFLVGETAESGAGKEYPPLPGGWRRIEEPAFSYITLGRYPAQASNQLISQEWIDAARSRWEVFTAQNGGKPPKGIRPLLGMDVADEGVDWNTIAPSYGNYIAPLEKWRGMDVDLTATNACSYYSEVNARQINVESDGIGASVAPKMKRSFYWSCRKCEETFYDDTINKCPNCKTEDGKPVDLTKEHINARKIIVGTKSKKKCKLGQFGCLRDELWWATREWLRTDQAMLPPDRDLEEELLTPTYGVIEGKIKVMNSKLLREKLGRSADSASALIQTRYLGSGRPSLTML